MESLIITATVINRRKTILMFSTITKRIKFLSLYLAKVALDAAIIINIGVQ